MHLICTYAFLEEFDMSGRMMMGGLCIQTLHIKMFHLYHTYNQKKLVNFFFFKRFSNQYYKIYHKYTKSNGKVGGDVGVLCQAKLRQPAL